MSTNTPDKKAASETESPTVRKGRSPAYPAVALDKAIEMARKVWDSQRKQEAHIDATMRALGYTSQSGASLRAISVLRQYGLIQQSGEGKAQRIKLTETAQDLILLPDTDDRKAKALKAAALAPAINLALWELYGAHLPADQQIIGPYLERDRGYHTEAAVDVIANYRISFALAKLDKNGDINPDDESDTDKAPNDLSNQKQDPLVDVSKPFKPMKAEATFQEMPILVGPGQVARIPFPMSEDDFELFIGTLQLWKKKLTTLPKPLGRAAIWKNNDHDQPVTIIGEDRSETGEVFYRVDGSNTRLPATQVRFI